MEEEILGRECSYFSLINNSTHVPLGFAVDYKRLYAGDLGPNTGGMGAYSPVPWLEKNAYDIVQNDIVSPLLKTLEKMKISYSGFLYCGLMWTKKGPSVLEFNVRLGDPETQVLAVSDHRDWLSLIINIIEKKQVPDCDFNTFSKAVGFVMTTKQYPYEKTKILSQTQENELDMRVFKNNKSPYCFAASVDVRGESVYTGSGRVLTVVGEDQYSFQNARKSALNHIDKIKNSWPDSHLREDIASLVIKEEARVNLVN